MRCKTKTLLWFWLSYVVSVSSVWKNQNQINVLVLHLIVHHLTLV